MQVWYIAGTLVLANTIAAVVVVLVAAIIVPTHATEEVGSVLALITARMACSTLRFMCPQGVMCMCMRPSRSLPQTDPEVSHQNSLSSCCANE